MNLQGHQTLQMYRGCFGAGSESGSKSPILEGFWGPASWVGIPFEVVDVGGVPEFLSVFVVFVSFPLVFGLDSYPPGPTPSTKV